MGQQITEQLQNGILIFRPHIGYYPDTPSEYMGVVLTVQIFPEDQVQVLSSVANEHVHSNNLYSCEMAMLAER